MCRAIFLSFLFSDEDELFSDGDSSTESESENEDDIGDGDGRNSKSQGGRGGDRTAFSANAPAAAAAAAPTSRPESGGSSTNSVAFGFRPKSVPSKNTPREEASSPSWNETAAGVDSKEDEEELDEETGQLLREAEKMMQDEQAESTEAKVDREDDKDEEYTEGSIPGKRPGSAGWFYGSGGKESDDEGMSQPLQLWPPLGVVAEALHGSATTSTNHAWVRHDSRLWTISKVKKLNRLLRFIYLFPSIAHFSHFVGVFCLCSSHFSHFIGVFSCCSSHFSHFIGVFCLCSSSSNSFLSSSVCCVVSVSFQPSADGAR